MRKPRNVSARRLRPIGAGGRTMLGGTPSCAPRGPRCRWTEDASPFVEPRPIGRVDDAVFATGETSVIGPSTSV